LSGDIPAGQDKSTFSWGLGVEFRIADKLWLATGLGNRQITDNTDSPVILIGNMRWEITSGP
jgi:hypothetical protein